MWYMPIVERNLVPDTILALGVRSRVRSSLREAYAKPEAERRAEKHALIDKLRSSPIAIHVESANAQHYELPPPFFGLVLGDRMKYSAGYWPTGINTLNAAEDSMLRLTVQRARLVDGQRVLELGAGWGSLSLWIAEHYPQSQVTAVTNSRRQQAFIQLRAGENNLANIEVLHADVARLDLDRRFDRVLSVEMFEHMKNYEKLLANIAGWLVPGGLLFVHHFSHRELLYEFDHEDPNDWMARTFFTGGTMPSHDLLTHFQRDLRIVDHWWMEGTHYARTLTAWRIRLRRHVELIRPMFRRGFGSDEATRQLANWRLFFIACAETFGIDEGQEYGITHVLMEKPSHRSSSDGEGGLLSGLRRGLGRIFGGDNDR